jgi:hypothetical protein
MTIADFCMLGVSIFNMEEISFHGFHRIDCDLTGGNWNTFSCIRALLRERGFRRVNSRKWDDELDLYYRCDDFTVCLIYGE